MSTIKSLLDQAKVAIERGEASLHDAAEYIAEAQAHGATQRQIAEHLGKSAAWVNRLLQWREGGCRDTPFGPQSKAKRKRVQATEQKKRKPATTGEQARAERARAHAEAEKARERAARAEAERAKHERKKAEADARRAREETKRAREEMRREAFSAMFGGGHRKREIHSSDRTLLVKVLGMLGSERDGEVLNAARKAESLRKKLATTWDELIIAAEEVAQAA
jgi:hypothetical protein